MQTVAPSPRAGDHPLRPLAGMLEGLDSGIPKSAAPTLRVHVLDGLILVKLDAVAVLRDQAQPQSRIRIDPPHRREKLGGLLGGRDNNRPMFIMNWASALKSLSSGSAKVKSKCG